jgi:hypothetical protein
VKDEGEVEERRGGAADLGEDGGDGVNLEDHGGDEVEEVREECQLDDPP